jgi:drug/metabolite transporter (DMT)-like permease
VIAAASQRVSPAAAGLLLTLASALLLSGLGVTTQLAFDAGATVGTLLSGRFLVAAAILWPLVWLIGSARPVRRQVLAGLLLGVAYSAHAWLFTASLARLDAGLVDLLVFTYPALVVLGAVALRRERWSRRRALALAAATAGSALVVVGGLGSIDPLGAALALASAVAYAAYILVSAGQLERTDPFLLTALVTTGAAVTLTAGCAVQHDLSLHAGAPAFALIAAVGVVAVAGMSTFVAGIARLGPARASIVSAVQPAVTPLLGYLVFADRLGPEQLAGGALVIAGVVILELRSRSTGLEPALSWLPRRERRRLAGVAQPVEVPAGRSLLRQGATADAFFVIECGRATVELDEDRIADMGPGDFFGEIALLHGEARTATVVAASDMRVRVVRRREFARAMQGGLPTLARAVRAAASTRLARAPGAVAAAH